MHLDEMRNGRGLRRRKCIWMCMAASSASWVEWQRAEYPLSVDSLMAVNTERQTVDNDKKRCCNHITLYEITRCSGAAVGEEEKHSSISLKKVISLIA